MLDLGCGPGLNGIAIVSEHQTMRGVSFDRPRTVAVAKKSIQDYGMENRMEAIGGDYAREPIGEDMGLLDQGFIADAAIRSGFRSVRSYSLDSDWGKQDLDIARK